MRYQVLYFTAWRGVHFDILHLCMDIHPSKCASLAGPLGRGKLIFWIVVFPATTLDPNVNWPIEAEFQFCIFPLPPIPRNPSALYCVVILHVL